MSYHFDKVARSERYFADTLLPHLLMSNDFEGLKKLMIHVFGKDKCPLDKKEFEIVTELDPLRDGGAKETEVKNLFKKFGRMAVPDLFLRWGHLILVIEAKFFTEPADDDLKEQMEKQKEAIEKVLGYTKYKKDHKIEYYSLTIDEVNTGNNLVWVKVLEIIHDEEGSEDIKYCNEIILNGIKQTKNESKSYKGKWKQKRNLEELISSIPDLIKDQYVWVGISGGYNTLNNYTLKELEERSHYKVSKE